VELGATSFGSASDLASALRRAEAAHGEYEKRIGQRDANWADWCAAYTAAEQSGKALPQWQHPHAWRDGSESIGASTISDAAVDRADRLESRYKRNVSS
jgi:hypothetical protein